LCIFYLNRNLAKLDEMPYEEVYFQRLKEENPEEYQKVTINKAKS
jgi:hypothetical protein